MLACSHINVKAQAQPLEAEGSGTGRVPPWKARPTGKATRRQPCFALRPA